MLKLRVSICRKVSDNNYGSSGAGCDLELELDSALLGDPDQLRRKIHTAYAIAAEAVAAQLGQQPAPRPARADDDRTADPPRERRRDDRPPARSGGGGSRGENSAPKNGRQLMGWLKKQDEALFERAVKLGKARDYPWKIADWDEDQAADVYHELTSKEPDGSGRWGGG